MSFTNYIAITILIIIYSIVTLIILGIGGPVIGDVCKFDAQNYWQCDYEVFIHQLWAFASSLLNSAAIFFCYLGWGITSFIFSLKYLKKGKNA